MVDATSLSPPEIDDPAVNLTRLRYFVAVADDENIVHAARRLRVAQPALSRQLRALEQEVGAPLFERHARGVTLTAAGTALLRHAREAIAAAEQGVAAARKAGVSRTTLRIAPPDWPHRAEMVATASERLRARMPDVDVYIDTTPWTISAASLRAGTIDVGFGIAPSAEQYAPHVAATWLIPEPTSSAVIPKRHPLAGRASLRLADLRDLPALIPPREQVGELHDQMLMTIRSGGYEPVVVPAPLNFSAASQMVVAGAGWIISVLSILEFPPPGTAVIPIEDASLLCGFYVLTRSDDRRAATRAFVECMQEVVADRAPSAAVL
jgi:DNA-binding transcriptional LysR family regulator